MSKDLFIGILTDVFNQPRNWSKSILSMWRSCYRSYSIIQQWKEIMGKLSYEYLRFSILLRRKMLLDVRAISHDAWFQSIWSSLTNSNWIFKNSQHWIQKYLANPKTSLDCILSYPCHSKRYELLGLSLGWWGQQNFKMFNPTYIRSSWSNYDPFISLVPKVSDGLIVLLTRKSKQISNSEIASDFMSNYSSEPPAN